MERLAWLECQPWLQPWLGCCRGACTPCGEGAPKLCHSLEWLLTGFASFHLWGGHAEAEMQGFGPLSPHAAHLFFCASPSAQDPAQMVLRLGFPILEAPVSASTSHSACSKRTNLVLTFDDSKPFLLDFRQVENISSWKPEMGCSLCNNVSTDSEVEDETIKKHPCVCRQMPFHITLKFRHVAMNIYSSMPFDERVEDYFQILFTERRHSIGDVPEYITVEIEAHKDAMQSIPDLPELLKKSEINFNNFFEGVDCMYACTVKAVDVCSADQHQMSQLLLHMAKHAGDHSQKSEELKILQKHMHFYLKNFQQQEKDHVATIWGCTAQMNQEVKAISATSLQNARQQIKQLEEAILWLDLVSAAYIHEMKI